MLSVIAKRHVNVILDTMITMELVSLDLVLKVSTLYFIASLEKKIILHTRYR